MSEELIPIGRTGRPHGLKGELKLVLEERYQSVVAELEVLFTEQQGRAVPHFVEYLRGSSENILKLERVDSREAAQLLSNRSLLARAADLPETEDPSAPETELVGYTLLDVELGLIGTIEEIIEMPPQYLASLTYHQRPVMVPIHPDLIVDIDVAQQRITMQLPAGLLDL